MISKENLQMMAREYAAAENARCSSTQEVSVWNCSHMTSQHQDFIHDCAGSRCSAAFAMAAHLTNSWRPVNPKAWKTRSAMRALWSLGRARCGRSFRRRGRKLKACKEAYAARVVRAAFRVSFAALSAAICARVRRIRL